MAKQNSGHREGGSVTVLKPDGSQMPLLTHQWQRLGRPVGGGRGW